MVGVDSMELQYNISMKEWIVEIVGGLLMFSLMLALIVLLPIAFG